MFGCKEGWVKIPQEEARNDEQQQQEQERDDGEDLLEEIDDPIVQGTKCNQCNKVKRCCVACAGHKKECGSQVCADCRKKNKSELCTACKGALVLEE